MSNFYTLSMRYPQGVSFPVGSVPSQNCC